jgi:hypothetical protein
MEPRLQIGLVVVEISTGMGVRGDDDIPVGGFLG